MNHLALLHVVLAFLFCFTPVLGQDNATEPYAGMVETAHPRVLIQRAERFLALGKTEAAIVWYKKVLDCCEGGDDAAEAHNDLGVAYARKGLLDEAVREYEASLAINGYALAHFNLGKALLRQYETGQDQALLDRSLKEFRIFEAVLKSGEPLPPVASSQREEIGAYLEEVFAKHDR